MSDIVRVRVNVDELCVHSEREDGRYGSWMEQYSSSLGDVQIDPKGQFEVIPQEDGSLYVVTCSYSTGDSFGRSEGNMRALAVCPTHTDAIGIINKLKKAGIEEYSITVKCSDGIERTIDNIDYGYFESVDYYEIKQFNLLSPQNTKILKDW